MTMAADGDVYGEQAMAALRKELKLANENLSSVQARCSELFTENRAMKMAAASLVNPQEWAAAVDKAMKDLKGV
jgi:ubiquinone biosynthesis protein UbiJ